MTREQLVMAEAVKMADARRMAESLRSQSRDADNARIGSEVHANGDGTRFDYHNEFSAPGGPLGSAASGVVMGGGPQREARASLQRLKKLLEAR